jgi:hypothetical protein
MWTEQEAAFLDDVTMNLVPDDACLAVKGKTVMKWDTTKKRYTLQKVDRDGKVMKERRNESGKVIKDGKNSKIDPTAIYKQWQKKTHLTLQRPGEREDKKMIAQAQHTNDNRKGIKDFQTRHSKEINRGEDVRDNKKLMETKKAKMISKLRESGKKKG